MSLIQLFITFILSALLVGCQSASNYLHSTVMPTSEFLKKTELGLLRFQQANYQESNKYFQEAVDIYRTYEDKSLISLSDIAIINYNGEGYDKVLLHNYNALNFLLMGDLESAKVETKNSNFIQKKEQQKFYAQIEKFKNTENKHSSILNRYEELFKSVNSEHNPYQNPFAHYVSALLYEEDNQYDESYIDIKNALNFHSDSKLLKEKLQLYKPNHITQTLRRAELFFDIGKSPNKMQIEVRVKTDKDRQNMLYLPTFKIYNSIVDKIVVTDFDDNLIAQSSTLCDIDAIKVNEFKEKLPSLIGKLVVESSKEVLSDALSKTSSSLGAVYKTFNVVYSQNNLMTWSNLPKKIDVISFIPKENKIYKLKFIDKNDKIIDSKKLKLNCSKKQKNCYQYYNIEEGVK